MGEHCTGIAEVVGSNPAQSLKMFSGLCSSSVTAAVALMTVIVCVVFEIFVYLFTVSTISTAVLNTLDT